MRKLITKISFLLISLVSLGALSVSLAWFSKITKINHEEFDASIVTNYFYSGDGSEERPYTLTDAQHVYNLAWLQDSGYFTTTKYFKLLNDIDMAGELDLDTGSSGAVPPIGTEAKPFVGFFDGDGKTISNLWVSTNPTDWKEKPENYASLDFTKGTGFFGYISKPENEKTYAGNFYLENIEISVNINCDYIGLVAGFVDASMGKIGVKNGIVSFESNNQVRSDYTLIGYTTEETSWTDRPDGRGSRGDLVINPSIDGFTNITSGKREVPDSMPGSAYFVGGLASTSPTPQPDQVKYYTGNIGFNGTSRDYNISSSSSSMNGTETNLDSEFVDLYNDHISHKSGITAIWPYVSSRKVTPGFNAVTGPNTYPTNSIWFQPQGAGNVCLCFTRQNSSSDNYMSLYRYQRNANGSLKSGSIQEIRFISKKNVKNGTVVYFEFSLTEQEATSYEYCIGCSSNGTPTTNSQNCSVQSAALVFLKLAATDPNKGQSGSGLYRELVKIEFVHEIPLTNPYSFDNENYKPDNSLLSFTGNSTSTTILKFDEMNTDHIVHYSNGNSSVIITEIIETDYKSIKDENSNYTPRETEK